MRKNILIALSIFLCSSTLLNAETYKLTSSGFINSETNNSEYIIEIPGVSQDNLYKSTKVILASESSYSNSQITDIDNETIIINGKDDNKIYAKFHNRDGNLWKYNYQYKLSFEDGKIIFEPTFKSLNNLKANKQIKSDGRLFSKKGKILHKRVVGEIEERLNDYIKSFEKNIKTYNQPLTSK